LGFFHTFFEVFAYGFLTGSALLNVVIFVTVIPRFLLQSLSPRSMSQ
jgi:hypothetical protein